MAGRDFSTPLRAYFPRSQARKLTGGVFWLGGCSDTGAWGGKWAEQRDRRHVYANAYLIVGMERSLLVETGHSAHWEGIVAQLDGVLGGRPLDLVFPTHGEIPHCGNLPRLAERYPDLTVIGDVRDYPLLYPSIGEERLRLARPGDTLDLGGVTVEFLAPIWHDLADTLWLLAREPAVLFCVDGLQHSHDHWAGDCGKVSVELAGLPAPALIEAPARDSIKWAPYTDLTRLGREFRELVTQRQPRIFAPSHGAPILAESHQLLDAIVSTVDAMSVRQGT